MQKLQQKMNLNLNLDTYLGQENQLFIFADQNEKFIKMVHQYKLDLHEVKHRVRK